MNVGEALGSISQPRVSIPEWEMVFQPRYEFNSDFCNASTLTFSSFISTSSIVSAADIVSEILKHGNIGEKFHFESVYD